MARITIKQVITELLDKSTIPVDKYDMLEECYKTLGYYPHKRALSTAIRQIRVERGPKALPMFLPGFVECPDGKVVHTRTHSYGWAAKFRQVQLHLAFNAKHIITRIQMMVAQAKKGTNQFHDEILQTRANRLIAGVEFVEGALEDLMERLTNGDDDAGPRT